MDRSRAPLAVAALPVAVVALFVLLPVVLLLAEGFGPEALPVLTDAYTWRVAGYTVALAALSTGLTVVLGLPVAGALHRLQLPGRRAVLALLTVAFVLPTVVVGLAYRVLLPSGWTGTTAAVLAAHVFFNLAVLVRIVGALWGHLDPRLEAVGRSLGLSGWQLFRRVTWPLLRPAVAAAGVLVFLFCLSSFGVVLVLGDPAWPTLEVEIFRRASQLLDFPAAAVLTSLQLLVVVATLLVAGRVERRAAVRQPLTVSAEVRRPVRTAAQRWSAASAYAAALWVLVPLVALAVRSITVGNGVGLDWYAAVLRGSATTASAPLAESLLLSLRTAVLATAIALALGAAAAVALSRSRSSWLDVVLSLPVGVSAVALGFGLLLLSVNGPVDLRATWWLLPLAQALVALPLVLRAVVPVLRSIDRRFFDVAAVLGAAPAQAWRRVEGPYLLRALLGAAGLAAAVSLGEFGATAFVSRAGAPTVTVQLVRLLGRPGEANLGQACALAVLLSLVVVAVVLLAERARMPGVGAL